MHSLFSSPRLGLAETPIVHSDRHGLVYLKHCVIYVQAGDVRASVADSDTLPAGDYALPYQAVSVLLMGPGSTISHDAMRILHRHGVALVVVGEEGTRCYSHPVPSPARSAVARAHAALWADEAQRLKVARRMYAFRFGAVLPHKDLDVLRGIEGGRIKSAYATLAAEHRIPWHGRKFDRHDPESTDPANQAINHVVTCVEAAAEVAVHAVGALPALGFIHEDPGYAFVLDVTDLLRTSVTIPVAFASAREHMETGRTLDSICRRRCATYFRKHGTIGYLIEKTKLLLEVAS